MGLDFFFPLPPECALCVEVRSAESTFTDGSFIRIVKSARPLQESFVPQHFQGRPFKAEHVCHVCGVSVFTDMKAATLCMNRYRKLGDCLYRGYLSPYRDGPVLPMECCPPEEPIRQWKEEHMDWYQLKEANPETIFKPVLSK